MDLGEVRWAGDAGRGSQPRQPCSVHRLLDSMNGSKEERVRYAVVNALLYITLLQALLNLGVSNDDKDL